MTIDVVDLREFYSRRLGIVARQMINRGIRERWPRVDGQRVLGLGYPTPYLGLFREDAERCIAFMPSAQGVLKWPTGRPALASLGTLEVIWIYNDFFWPLLFISDGSRLPVTTSINNLQGEFVSDYNLISAGATLTIIPTLAIYLALQRQFVAGLTLGGSKG